MVDCVYCVVYCLDVCVFVVGVCYAVVYVMFEFAVYLFSVCLLVCIVIGDGNSVDDAVCLFMLLGFWVLFVLNYCGLVVFVVFVALGLCI